jgi:hypothetical protein
MNRVSRKLMRSWASLGARYMPFAEAATPDLPLSRLLRLSLFQLSVGMALVLLVGTLNRVMIVELGVPASLVGVMISLPLLFAPFRALIGFRSDTHRSQLGWRRVPPIRRRPWAISRRGWRFCWSGPGCTRRKPSAWRWPRTSPRSNRSRMWSG